MYIYSNKAVSKKNLGTCKICGKTVNVHVICMPMFNVVNFSLSYYFAGLTALTEISQS